MIGQTLLQAQFNNYTLSDLPKTILLLGEEGCGKHLIAQLLAKRLNIDLVDINKDEFNAEDLTDYLYCPIKKLYLIDLSELQLNQQNKILKFIEEPSESVNIILTAETIATVLPTVLNRCIQFTFEKYSTEELKQIKEFDEELVYKIATTPGQLLSFDYNKLDSLYILCDKIIDYADKASFQNVISIITSLNTKDNLDKYDIKQFLKLLRYKAFDKFMHGNQTGYIIFTLADNYLNKLTKYINKECLMLDFLSNLWKESRI